MKDLASTAQAEIDLLRLCDQQGDEFALHRPVDFVSVSTKESQASAVAGLLERPRLIVARPSVESRYDRRVQKC